jgi:aminocarboxymuconate-semialdehyde decarboxylase
VTAPTQAPVVDVHAHFVPPALPDMAERYGDPRWPLLVRNGGTGEIVQHGRRYRSVDDGYWSVAKRIEHLDAVGIGVQVLSPLPVMLPFWAEADRADYFCRAHNEELAGIVRDHPDRFLAFGAVPLQDPARAIKQVGQVRGLGLAGLEFGTWVGADHDLGDPAYADVFRAAAEAGLPVLLHPNAPSTFPRAYGPEIQLGIGVGCDTARAMASMHLAGILRDLAGLRLCLAHGGGAFMWLWPRFRNLAIRAGADGDLPAGLYLDTAGLAEDNLPYLQQVHDQQRMVFGSDLPATGSDRAVLLLETCRRVAAATSWDIAAATSSFLRQPDSD